MPAAPRLFTLDEANALVPQLEQLIQRMQLHYLKLQSILGPAADNPDELARRLQDYPELRSLLDDIERCVKTIQETGAEFKGVELGLVDFRAVIDGQVGYLCWQFGEKEIRWWHTLEGGFGGRRPLPGAPERTALN